MERWDTLSTQRRKPTTDLTPGHVQVSSGIKYIRNKKENVRNSTLIPGKNVSRDLGGAPLFIHLKKKLSSLEFLSTHTHNWPVRLFLPGTEEEAARQKRTPLLPLKAEEGPCRA